jgi:tricarballylate dehydrogenase
VAIAVIGSGSAGFQAAVAARQAGAERVVILEKAAEAEYGGNARYSPTIFRFVHNGHEEIREFLAGSDEGAFRRIEVPPYSAGEFIADLKRISHGRIDPDLAETLVAHSNAALHWMLDLGFEWQPSRRTREIDGVLHFEPGMAITPRDGGIGQLARWREIAAGLGIEIRFESAVRGILGSDREVEGVRVSGPDGEYDLHAASVILCSGGFQASAEQRARYLGRNADLMKVLGSRHDTGEVMRMALALGAAATGHWQGAHSSPIDGEQPDQGWGRRALRDRFAFGITVNRAGRRFLDEGATPAENVDGWIERVVLKESGGGAYQVFDATGRALLGEDYDEGSSYEAASIKALGSQIMVDPPALLRTVDAFNRAVDDSVPFDPTVPDGKATAGLTPAKSNWATRIETPPFYAFPVTAGITFSFGGLKINTDAQVMNTAGQPIEGLYASGDIVGLYYDHHLSASGQTRNAVFSRIAAAHAVKHRVKTAR